MTKISVKTFTICDFCKFQHERDGSEPHHPPVGWTLINMSTRAPGDGWSGGGLREDNLVCPPCFDTFIKLMNKLRRNEDNCRVIEVPKSRRCGHGKGIPGPCKDCGAP